MSSATAGALETPSRRRGLWQVHLGTLLVGATGLFGPLAQSGPALLVAVRSLTAALVLLVVLLAKSQSVRPATRRDGWLMLLAGVVLALHWLAFFHSIQLAGVGIGLLSFSSYPLFVTALEPWAFREKYRRSDLLTALLVTVGLALVTPTPSLSDQVTRGVVWGVLSALALAGLSLLNRAQVRHQPALVITFHQMVWCAALALPLHLWRPEPVTPTKLGWLLLMGAGFTALPQLLFVLSLRHLRAQAVSVAVALEPVYGIALACWLLGERLAGRVLLGGLLIFAAALLSLRQPEGKAGSLA